MVRVPISIIGAVAAASTLMISTIAQSQLSFAETVTALGPTVLSFKVEIDGTLKDVTVVKSSGNATLDESAAKWVTAKWRYKPALSDGHPVETTTKAQILWRSPASK